MLHSKLILHGRRIAIDRNRYRVIYIAVDVLKNIKKKCPYPTEIEDLDFKRK